MSIIRLATPDDIETLTSLRVAFLEEIGDIADGQQREAFRQATFVYLSKALPQESFLAWVVEEDGQIVATSGLIFFEQAPTPLNLAGIEGYILNIYTLPAWRSRGLGKKLMETIIAYAKAQGIPSLWLYATDQGTPLYKKVGFFSLHDAMGLRILDE